MFTVEHWMWIGLCAAGIAGLCVLSIRKKFSLKTAGGIMTAICALSEVSKVLSNMVESPEGGMHLDPRCLPLHLCSLMIFAVLCIAFGKEGRLKQMLINFLAVMGTLGSFCAILIPTNGTEFATLPAYQCFVYHAGLMWFSIYLILSGRAKLGSFRVLGENMGLLMLAAFLMLYVNGALSAYDTNFFYLTRPPMEGLPVLNLDQGWYIYLLRLNLVGIALITLFHLPFIFQQRCVKKNKSKGSAAV